MKLYSENEHYKLYEGNMLDMLDVIEPNSIDSIITDPPYELGFMGKDWDNAGVSFKKETWEKCYEALKEGGYMLVFGGSRTYHRIAVAIEDAGFEIRDTIMWLYGSGFPKSMNIGLAIDKKNGVESEIIGKKPYTDKKNVMNVSNYNGERIQLDIKKATNEWQGWGTALKPSFEPIIVARKPFKGTLIDNVIKNGVGGLNIDECRVETQEKIETGRNGRNNKSTFQASKTNIIEREYQNKGRFPANTILTYDETDFDEVCGGFPETKAKQTKGSDNRKNKGNSMFIDGVRNELNSYIDSGSASRYFYCAKASKRDRNEGLDQFDDVIGGTYQFRQDGSLDGQIPSRKNIHPTVKPTDLMQYLIRLVSPKGATILDPFNGSGSTGKAVMYENIDNNKDYKYIGIELTEKYLSIAKARIDFVINK